MLPYVEFVVRSTLLKSYHRTYLGNENFDDIIIASQYFFDIFTAKHFYKLASYPLGGNLFEQSFVFTHGKGCLHFGSETQLRGKAQTSQYTQSVLEESLIGRTYRAEYLLFKISPAAELVDNISVLVHRHCVYRQVAAFKVFFQTFCEGHAVGTAVVGIAALGTICGYLNYPFSYNNAHSAVLFTVGGDIMVGEYFLYLLRESICGDVIVVGGDPHKVISHAPAYCVSFKTVFFQSIKYLINVCREY